MEYEFEPPLQPPIMYFRRRELGGTAVRAADPETEAINDEYERTLETIRALENGQDIWS